MTADTEIIRASITDLDNPYWARAMAQIDQYAQQCHDALPGLREGAPVSHASPNYQQRKTRLLFELLMCVRTSWDMLELASGEVAGLVLEEKSRPDRVQLREQILDALLVAQTVLPAPELRA